MPAQTFAQRRFHTKKYTHCAWGLNNRCAPAGRRGRAHRHRPYQSPSYFSAQFHTNEINRPRAIHPKRNRRGGACVPDRTSAQRRFHTKKHTHCAREFNDGCALVGQHGRAPRHRPYPSPSYFSTQSHTNKITICTQSTQRKPTVHVQSAPTQLHQTARCAHTASRLYFR